MTDPRRSEPKRLRGGRKEVPAESVYVGRGSKWANPYARRIKGGEDGLSTSARRSLVEDYREWMTTPLLKWEGRPAFANRGWVSTDNTSLFGIPYEDRPSAELIKSLAGKDLVCMCHLFAPCHADVLLELANSEDQS